MVLLPTRHGIVLAMALCPSDFHGRSFSETAELTELIFGLWASLEYPILCYKDTWVSPKIRALLSETLSPI